MSLTHPSTVSRVLSRPDLIGPNAGGMPRRESTAVVELECDTVILVTARKPNDELFHALKARRDDWSKAEVEDIFRIGDCHAPRQCNNAIFDGHRLAREFDSPHPQYPMPWIRERQIWGSETYPKLGDPRPVVEPTR